MAVQVMMPQKRQETSMGRRLFAMAAPIAGGMIGGPAGAAAGGVIGSKMAGGTGADAALSGAQAGFAQHTSDTKADLAAKSSMGLTASQGLQKPELGASAFGRRLNASTQNPQVAIDQGLDALTAMPQPLREQYTPALIKAKMHIRQGAY